MPFSLSSSALNDYQRFLSLLVGNDAYDDIPALTVDYLVIAGGGGGGGRAGAGGGAGGYRSSISGESSGGGSSAETALSLSTSTNYTVTIGAGGSGGNGAVDPNIGTNGTNSVFATITSNGGGAGGGANTQAGNDGGSGGGGSRLNGAAGSGTANQGFDGGSGSSTTGSAGGGGASQAGTDGSGSTGGDGGNGISSSITGSAVTRAGGGGAGGGFSPVAATPGSGGAGGGGTGSTSTAQDGEINTGGGASGGGYNGSTGFNGGTGGSGLVVAKYPITYDMTVSAGLGYKTVMSGEYKITEFTAGTGTVSFALAPTVTGFSEDILQEIALEDSAASVTFANLDQYASTYQHLQIRYTARSTRASSGDDLAIQFNSDTAGNYAYHLLQGNGSSAGSFASTSQTEMAFMRVTSDGDTADAFGAGVIDLLDVFETSKYTTIRGLSGGVPASNLRIRLNSGLWMDTAAITTIKCFALAGNLTADSRFTLIGVK